jgi:peptide/nickel transport system substrate-binding protein
MASDFSRISRRRALIAATQLSTVVLLTNACSFLPGTPQPGSQTGSPSTQIDELRLALGSLGNEAFDPTLGPPNNDVFADFMFDTLVGADYPRENLSKTTGIASDWTLSDDRRTYTFKLRPWKFHNGDDLTAEDVKFSLDRLVTSTAGQVDASLSSALEAVTINSPSEVEFRLKAPVLKFLWLMAQHNGQIMPKKYFESAGTEGFEKMPVASGPYKVVEHQVGSHVTFEQAYPQHFGIGVPRFKRVTVRLVTEASTKLAMLKSGEADFIDVGIKDVKGLQAAGFQAFPSRGTEALQVLFQWFRPEEATADINVRKALSYAINRDEINQTFLSGLGKVTATNIQNLGNPILPPQPYDLTMAQQFIDQTPYRRGGQKLTMYLQVPIRIGWPDQLAIAQVIQNSWQQIGVQSELFNREYGSYRPEWASHTLKAPAATLFTNVGPAYSWLGMARNQYGCAGTLTNQCDPAIDRLLDEWGAATTDEVANAKAAAIEKIVVDNFYMIMILQSPLYFVGGNKVRSDYTPAVVIGGVNSKTLAWNVR